MARDMDVFNAIMRIVCSTKSVCQPVLKMDLAKFRHEDEMV
jgi:hypothetical protein